MTLKPLKQNDLIAIAAPAGPFDRRRFLRGVRRIKKAGFRVAFDRDIFKRQGYLAGDDRRRSGELNRHLSSPKAKALLFARGGFGCQRLLPLLKSRVRPKIVVGSSDLTVILNYLWQRFRLPSFYGPMVAPHLVLPGNIDRLKCALTDPHFFRRQKLTARKVLKTGSAEGRIAGGCLTLLVATLGTSWEIETRNTLLCLEDTDEAPYAVDRMLTQLEQAGKFRGVRGIVLGTFRRKKNLFPKAVESVFREKLKSFRGPVLWGVRFGHCPDPLLLPLGGHGSIRRNRLIIHQGVLKNGSD